MSRRTLHNVARFCCGVAKRAGSALTSRSRADCSPLSAPCTAVVSLSGAVLFACSFNGVRSPMARALTQRLLRSRFFVASCGAQSREGELDPFMLQMMDEVSEDDSFDLLISLTPSALHRASAPLR